MAGNGAVLARCAGHNGGFIFFKQFPHDPVSWQRMQKVLKRG